MHATLLNAKFEIERAQRAQVHTKCNKDAMMNTRRVNRSFMMKDACILNGGFMMNDLAFLSTQRGTNAMDAKTG